MKEMCRTRQIEAEPRTGLQPRFMFVPFRAHRPVPIIAQDFSPGLSKKERRMTRCIEAEPRTGLQSRFLHVPLWGHTDLSQSLPRTSVLGGLVRQPSGWR